MIAALVHASLTGALLALGAACLAPVLRAARRPTRHLWLGTLVLAATWPALQRAAVALLPRAAETEPTIGAALLAPVVVGATAASTRWSVDDIMTATWLVLSALLVLRLAVAMRRLARERASWRQDRIDGVPVRVAPDAGPAVVGFGRMEIVVPQWIVSLDPALRLLALRHEEEHRAARDPLLLLGAAVAVALLPWNLPLWWIARRLRLAIELDCDARVLRHYPDATRYGRLLLLFAQRPGARPLAPALSEPATNLQRRIDAMSTTFRLSARRGALLGAATSLLVGAACSLRAPTNATNASTPPTSDAAVAPTREPPKAVDAGTALLEHQVEKPARVTESVAPRYPVEQRAAGVDGDVLAQFVVDTSGRAEMETFRVLKSNHDAFTQAVRTSLALMQFRPAEVGGRKVRQVVQMPFRFTVSREAEPGPPPAPPAAKAAPDAPDPGPRPADTGGFFEFSVNKAVIKHAVPPRYPDHLRAANVEGKFVATFVVDTTGTADLSSFRVRDAVDTAFVAAARAALERMTFHPATVSGRKIRQVMEMPFEFSLSK